MLSSDVQEASERITNGGTIPIVVVCAANGSYAMPLAVMLRLAWRISIPSTGSRCMRLTTGSIRKTRNASGALFPIGLPCTGWRLGHPRRRFLHGGKDAGDHDQKLTRGSGCRRAFTKPSGSTAIYSCWTISARLWHEPLAGNVVLAVQYGTCSSRIVLVWDRGDRD